MDIQEAVKILKPKTNTHDALKIAYRIACKKYHPDLNPNGLELMKLINAAHAYLEKNLNQWDGTKEPGLGIDETIANIFTKINHCDGLDIELCGTWLWVSGNTRLWKTCLKENGFFWANKKKKWYWRATENKRTHGKAIPMDKIRTKYGSKPLPTFQRLAII